MQTVHVEGSDLKVLDRGAGSPVLLVHGFPLDHTMWRPQIEFLSQTHRVIAPDLRGFGGSMATPGTVSMERFADDLSNVLTALGIEEPVTLCGLSMGGYIAWQFWRKHTARLRRLVLCDTRAQPDGAEAAENRHALADRVLAEGPSVTAEAMLPKLFASQTQTRMPEVIEAQRRVMLAATPDGIAAALRGMAERPDARPWLASIRVPTLVIVGSEDTISPPDEMRQIASAIPGAQFVEVPGAAHMAPLEQPEAVNSALRRFLGA
ncbi:MAG: alpha/beta fold hydrolase [Planctomycetes bacterium]|nr:alpha/beta fold hydrolase [Planctomycetota bacterium]